MRNHLPAVEAEMAKVGAVLQWHDDEEVKLRADAKKQDIGPPFPHGFSKKELKEPMFSPEARDEMRKKYEADRLAGKPAPSDRWIEDR